MNERKLNFEKGNMEVLTLEELERTHVENYRDGSPVGGIYHYDLIHFILDLLEKNRIGYKVKEIFAVDNRHGHNPGVTLHHDLEESFGIQAPETYTLRRVFANINLESADDDMTTNLAVSYTQQGIAIGWGPFCYVCHNQTICSSEHILSNYTLPGNSRIPTSERDTRFLLSRFSEAFMKEIALAEQEISDVMALKDLRLDAKTVREFIGEATICRTLVEARSATVRQGRLYPISDANINRMVEALSESTLLDGCSGYELLNAANYYCKPRHSTFENIMPQSLMIYQAISGYSKNGKFNFV